MQRQVAGVLLVLYSLLILTTFSGCELKYAEAKHPKCICLILIDPNFNDSPFEIIELDNDPNKRFIKCRSSKIVLEKPCRVNYLKDYTKKAVVSGMLSNGKEYPVVIDSGFPGAEIIVNDVVAKENDLGIVLNKAVTSKQKTLSAEKRHQHSLCFLPQLKIGELTIEKPCCAYLPWHMEMQLFGLTLYQDKDLLLGLSLMSRFRYIRFDNTKRQLEFSYDQSFLPEEPTEWTHYPFTLQEIGSSKSERIMVDIPIAEEICNIAFDTAGAGTVLMTDTWEKIRNRVISTTQNSKFVSFMHDSLSCSKAIIKTLSVGNVVIKNAEVMILPEDTPYLEKDMRGYISIWTFKDTSVVLDFESSLMWIKNQESK
ncbi:MAG: hypothetical protein JXB29_06125 [Sedimentisphaerales bacterium]|nr:hypothetical protein [Sedimentisphaerales bacterium]